MFGNRIRWLIPLSAAAAGLSAFATTDVEGGWVGVVAAVLASSALAITRPRQDRGRVALLGVLACVVLGWSLTERVVMTVSVRGDRIQVRAGGDLVQARDGRYATGSSTVWLSGTTQSRPARAVPESIVNATWLADLFRLPYQGYRSGLAVSWTAGDGSMPAGSIGTIWQSDDVRQAALVSAPERDLALEISGLRPATPYGLLTRLTSGEAYQVLAIPETRDLSLSRVRDGRIVQELENRGSPYRKDWQAALQAVARELSRTWLFAALMVSLGTLLSSLVAWTGVLGSSRKLIDRACPSGALRNVVLLWRRSRSPGRSRDLRAGFSVLLLGLVAFLCTAWIAVNVFEGVPHDRDSVAYLFQARIFASGHVTVPAPSLPEFFKEDFIISNRGQWFGKYPPGHPLVLAVGLLLGVPQLVGPVMASVSVVLLCWLGTRLYGRGLGLLSGALMVVSPFFLFMSGSFLAHTTSLTLTLGALAVAADLLGTQTRSIAAVARPWWGAHGHAVWLGALMGALIATRQLTGVALGLCLALWLTFGTHLTVLERARRAALLSAGALLPVLGLLAFQYVTTGNALMSPQLLWWDFDKIGFGAGIGAEGWHDPALGLHDTWDRLTELQRHLFGWPFYLTLAPAMIPFVLGRARRQDWFLLTVVCSLVGVYVLYWNRGMAYGPRYYYEALGPLCLLTARGFEELTQLISERSSTTGRCVSGAMLGSLVAFSLLFYVPQQIREFRGYLGVDGRRMRLVQDAGVNQGIVFVREEPRGGWQAYASVFWLNTPRLDGSIIFARDRGVEENERLIVATPGRAAYLLSQTGLTPIRGRAAQ